MSSRKIPDEWRHKVKKGFPIRSKWIKGYEYAYQRLAAGRDRETGKVWVQDYHLGAWSPARPKPIMEQLTAADRDQVVVAWRDGESMDMVIERIKTHIGYPPTPDMIYKWFRAHGVKRGARTTKRAEKRITAAVEQVEQRRAEKRERMAAQARCRALFDAKKGKRKFSEEHKRKLSEARKRQPGRLHTAETKRKLSEMQKGKPGTPHTVESKRKISKAHKGKKLSEEHKRKLSEAWKDRVVSEETRKKIGKAHKGKKTSEETRKKMSARKQGIAYDDWEAYACEMKYCPKFNEACRESCRAKYNHRCFMCGKKQADNKTKTGKVRKLSVHHVDMDKAQGCESNWKLVPLCAKCHPATHNDEMIGRLGYILKE